MHLHSWFLFIIISCSSLTSSGKIRKVAVSPDQVVVVRTAPGIATIIQVPDRPNSLVVGNTESFKVEYLEQAITIKPLHSQAKSNLYIYTDYRRFNVQLVTGSEASADYVVYLENKLDPVKKAESKIKWMSIRRTLTNDALTLEVVKIGGSRDGILFVEFRILGQKKEKIDPAWFWLSQGGSTKPIQQLVLSRLETDPRAPAQGMVQILRSDISDKTPLRLELRRKKTSHLTLPEVKSWK